jgi:tRNA threonylcarbamoyladenosine biosynthesis protein TsaB
MPSLRQLLAAHPVLLLLDAASARVQVALWAGDSRAAPLWWSGDDEAGVAIFAGVESLLAQAGRSIGGVEAFAYCEGPGSLLGIRTAAMALRVWSAPEQIPVFAYQSIELVVRSLADPDLSVIVDARRELWHVAKLGSPARRVPTAALTGALAMPEHFRHWSALPANVGRVPYDLAALLPALADEDLFQPSAEPDALRPEPPTYAAWTPQVHRAPLRT